METKLLIVEDDANTSAALAAQFSAAGYQVITHNGNSSVTEVIKLFQDTQPNYIILDLMLPKIDGFELLGRFKADEHGGNPPVIVYTNFSDQDTRGHCERLGADHFFVKADLGFDAFVEKVAKIVGNREKLKKD